MMFATLLYVSVIASLVTTTVVDWKPLPGSELFYHVLYNNDQKFTMDQAAEYCKAHGGELASIHSQAENDFIYSLTTTTNVTINDWLTTIYLIGVRRNDSWQNVDKTQFDWNNFGDGYQRPNERCAVLIGKYIGTTKYADDSGRWLSIPCDREFKSLVCEKRTSIEEEEGSAEEVEAMFAGSYKTESVLTVIQQDMETEQVALTEGDNEPTSFTLPVKILVVLLCVLALNSICVAFPFCLGKRCRRNRSGLASYVPTNLSAQRRRRASQRSTIVNYNNVPDRPEGGLINATYVNRHSDQFDNETNAMLPNV